MQLLLLDCPPSREVLFRTGASSSDGTPAGGAPAGGAPSEEKTGPLLPVPLPPHLELSSIWKHYAVLERIPSGWGTGDPFLLQCFPPTLYMEECRRAGFHRGAVWGAVALLAKDFPNPGGSGISAPPFTRGAPPRGPLDTGFFLSLLSAVMGWAIHCDDGPALHLIFHTLSLVLSSLSCTTSRARTGSKGAEGGGTKGNKPTPTPTRISCTQD